MGKIEILPIYPEFPATFWSYKSAVKIAGKKASMPPTGLLTALAMLPEKEFHIQNVVDLNFETLSDEQIKGADFILASAMGVQKNSLNNVVERAHKLGKKVIVGGPFVTSYPDLTEADFLVTGEAELTMQPFLDDLLNGVKKGVWTAENVKGRSNTKLTDKGRVDITDTPLPRWDLINLKNYVSAAVQYSRGCPFNCDFCDITALYGQASRTKTPEQMIKELDKLYDLGHRGSVFIVDDNFIGNRVNVMELLPELIKWQKERDYPFALFTEASMNLAWEGNADILQSMHDAGFDFVFTGIESIDKDVLKIMGKKQNTVMSQLDSVKKIQKAGMEVAAGFIIGSDGAKEDVFENLFEFIQEAGIPVAMPGLLNVMRGTKLYARLEKEGRIRSDSDGNNTHSLSFNFEPEGDEEFLIKGYRNLLDKLFNPKSYYERCRNLQKNIGSNHAKRKEGFDGIFILGRSVKTQLFARGGFEYAKYLISTAFRNPKYFSTAVSEAIKFHHFRLITKAMLDADRFNSQLNTLYARFSNEASRIYSDTKIEMQRRCSLIKAKADKMVFRAEKRLSKLHKDFVSEPKKSFEELKNRIFEDVIKYETV